MRSYEHTGHAFFEFLADQPDFLSVFERTIRCGIQCITV